MTTHLLKSGLLSELTTRCGIAMVSKPKRGQPKAGKDDTIGTEDGLVYIDCAGCLRDLIVEMRIKQMVGGDTPANRWLCGGDVGRSSYAIWSAMVGRDVPGYDGDIPHDPADFGRCHKLLEQFPQWRGWLPKMSMLDARWLPFVEAWDELTALYLEELPTGRAPKLYDRMKELGG